MYSVWLLESKPKKSAIKFGLYMAQMPGQNKLKINNEFNLSFFQKVRSMSVDLFKTGVLGVCTVLL